MYVSKNPINQCEEVNQNSNLIRTFFPEMASAKSKYLGNYLGWLVSLKSLHTIFIPMVKAILIILLFSPFAFFVAHLLLKYLYGKDYYKKRKPLLFTKDDTFKSVFKIKKNDED